MRIDCEALALGNYKGRGDNGRAGLGDDGEARSSSWAEFMCLKFEMPFGCLLEKATGN